MRETNTMDNLNCKTQACARVCKENKCHILLTSRQTASCNSPHDWLVSLAMNLAALCDMWW